MCKDLISKQGISPFQDGFVTSLNMREFLGGTAKKSKSISFKGLTTQETFDLIINHVKSLNK